jgi:hypothetical protein
MSNTITFDASLFEDKYLKFRLSSRYAVDNKLFSSIGYDTICNAFFEVCPNLCIVNVYDRGIRNNDLLALGNLTREFSAWCSENCSGYWMNANFPSHITTKIQGNLLNRYWSFQNVEDAIMFKLKFC